MIIQSKETTKASSLIELLGGSTKSKTGKGDSSFAQLLTSFGNPIKDEKTFEIVADAKISKNPKKVPTKPIGAQKLLVTSHSNDGLAPVTAKSLTENAPKTNDKVNQKSKKLEDLLQIKETPKATMHDDLVASSDEKKIFPKELIDALSNDQVKSLIGKARDYLKNAIVEKSPEMQGDIKTMPKTLMGLVELAHTIGIDMSEITLATVEDNQKPLFSDIPLALASKSLIALQEPTLKQTSEIIKGQEALVALMSDVKPPASEAKQQKDSDVKLPVSEAKQQTKGEKPLQSLIKALDTSPALANETIKNILQEAVPKEQQKAILPTHTEALSALLQNTNESEKTEEKTVVKSADEGSKTLHTLKTDSLEVKSKEAVQSMRHFAIDLKEAAESYKPPFTRVSMKLNPERLGEVEVTLVQRGNNVHVNIQSNNASSIAFLAHNATELKAQLAGQGITNTTMNFMSNGEHQQQGSHNQQHQPNRFLVYESLQELESTQQELSALEIILPHYA